MDRYARTRLTVFSLASAVMVFLMGTDTERMPWGDPLFWFTGYFVGVLGLVHFAWRPDLWKFRWVVVFLSSIVTLRTIVHLVFWTPQLVSAFSYNGFFTISMVVVYIQMRLLGRVPERWEG